MSDAKPNPAEVRMLQEQFLKENGISLESLKTMNQEKRDILRVEFDEWMSKKPKIEPPPPEHFAAPAPVQQDLEPVAPTPPTAPVAVAPATDSPAPEPAAQAQTTAPPAEQTPKRRGRPAKLATAQETPAVPPSSSLTEPSAEQEPDPLAQQPFTGHGAKTLVVDTIDRLYTLCEAHFLVKVNNERKAAGEPPLDDLGDLKWGKGYTIVEQEFNRVITKLNFSGCPIVFLCHESERKIEKKHMKIDRVQPDLSKRAMPIIFDLSDLLVYYGYNQSDERVLWMKPTEDRLCGCRGPIGKSWPDNINPTFESIDEAIKNVTGKGYADRRCIITVYGTPKIGKSSLASTFPNPVVADCENGWKFLDGHDVTLIRTWKEFLAWCQKVTKSDSE